VIAKLPTLRVSVRKGASADIALRLETSILKFSAISAMTQSAPLRVTSTGHGLLDQWHAASRLVRAVMKSLQNKVGRV
jgi:hypothetical protein